MTPAERIVRLYEQGWTPCFPITSWMGARALPSAGIVEPFLLPGTVTTDGWTLRQVGDFYVASKMFDAVAEVRVA